MLTRARRGLIVIGEAETLVHSSEWAAWLEWVQANGVACSPGWRAPPRPPAARAARRHRHETDEMGRSGRRSRSRSASPARAHSLKPPSRAERRAMRKARAVAASGDDEEEVWRRTLREGVADANGTQQLADVAGRAAHEPHLLPNWFSATDSNGYTYYHNAATRETCWQPPLRLGATDEILIR